MVIVRSRMPGNVASGTCSPLVDQVLVHLIGDRDQVVLAHKLGDGRKLRAG